MHRVDTMLQLRLSGPPQRAAVQHMVQRELMHEPEGGILNIEAGFGKTFVVMALMHALPKPTVLVTEPSLVPQLCSELRTWLGPEGFTVCDYVSMSRDDCVDLGLGLQDHTKGQAGRIALVLPYTQTARVNVALRTRAPWGRIIAGEYGHGHTVQGRGRACHFLPLLPSCACVMRHPRTPPVRPSGENPPLFILSARRRSAQGAQRWRVFRGPLRIPQHRPTLGPVRHRRAELVARHPIPLGVGAWSRRGRTADAARP